MSEKRRYPDQFPEFQSIHTPRCLPGLLTGSFKVWSKWEKKSKFKKVLFVAMLPLHLVFIVTIPTVKHKDWSKGAAICWPVGIVILTITALEAWDIVIEVNESFITPLWVILEVVAVIFSIIIFFTCTRDAPPVYHQIFVAVSFVVEIIWIYLIANELISLILTIGIILKVSPEILGITVLAWGNSIGDMASDVVVARKGFPDMAIAACLGGPLFNLLLGLGLSLSAKCFELHPAPFPVVLTPQLTTALSYLGFGLVATLFWANLNKYYISRKHGIFLIIYYLTFTVVSIVLLIYGLE